MLKLKYVLLFLFVTLIAFFGQQYTSKKLEDKVKLSMENHNKSGSVIFEGVPDINILLGRFEIKEMKIKSLKDNIDMTADLKVVGLNYYNYLLNKELFSDKVIINIDGLKEASSNKVADNLIIIKKEIENISVNYNFKSYYIDSKGILEQELELDLNNVPTLYDSLNKELSSFFMKREDFRIENINKIVMADKGTAALGGIRYKVNNNDFINEILSEGRSIEETNRLKVDVINYFNTNIDKYKLEELNPNIKEIAKRLINEKNSSLTFEIKNNSNVAIKNLILNSIISTNPVGVFKKNYDIKLE